MREREEVMRSRSGRRPENQIKLGQYPGAPRLHNIRQGSHTLGANRGRFGKEGGSADQQAIVIVTDLIASNVPLSQGWTTGGEPQ